MWRHIVLPVFTLACFLVVLTVAAQSPDRRPGGLAALESSITTPTIPSVIEPNRGQFAGPSLFGLRSMNGIVLLSADRADFVTDMAEVGAPASVAMRFLSARSSVKVRAQGELPGKSHYFRGRQTPVSDVPHYSSVVYESLYQDVDLAFRTTPAGFEYEFIVQPGGDPNRIRFRMSGAESLAIDKAGDLLVNGATWRLTHRAPNAYQDAGGTRREVPAAFTLVDGNIVTLKLGAFDRTQPLVIDPELVFTAGVGGRPTALAVAQDESVWLTGFTATSPTQVFVARLSSDGSTLLSWTEVGGGSFNIANDLAIDSLGDVWVVGRTSSSDWPTANAVFGSLSGASDAFLLKLDPTGSRPVLSTFLGGSRTDEATAVVVDDAGRASVVGWTYSADLSRGMGASGFQPTIGGDSDAFLVRFAPGGSTVEYWSYLGGAGRDQAGDIAQDRQGNTVLVGTTYSPDFPVVSAFQQRINLNLRSPDLPPCSVPNCSPDAFFAKVDPTGYNLLAASYLGGSQEDYGYTIAVDSGDAVYVAGTTFSFNFPFFFGLQTKNLLSGFKNSDAFLAKIAPEGNRLVFSTCLGGSKDDSASAVALDQHGQILLVGQTNSPDFPVANSDQSSFGGGTDGFLAQISAAGDVLAYSTYVGGANYDSLSAVALSPSGPSFYITGCMPLVQTLPGAGPGCGFVVGFTAPLSGAPPFAYSAVVLAVQGRPAPTLLRAFDEDGDPLSYFITEPPTHGTLGGTPPNLTYTPVADYVGTDSLTFRVSDGTQVGNAAVISFIVERLGGSPQMVLGTLGGASSVALDVNNHGQVVGWSQLADGRRHAFLWTSAGAMTDLGTLGGSTSEAQAINDVGLVVGFSQSGDGSTHAFKWDAISGMVDLGPPGSAESKAYALSQNGFWIVGVNERRAFLFGSSGHDLGTLGGSTSTALGLNETFQVVGESATVSGDTHAFLRQECALVGCSPSFTDLGTLGGHSSSAAALNSSAVIVGSSEVALDLPALHAFRWTTNRGMEDLGVLEGSGPSSFAASVNQAGLIVGWSGNFGQLGERAPVPPPSGSGGPGERPPGSPPSDGGGSGDRPPLPPPVPPGAQSRAFVWTPESGMQELHGLGGDVSQAFALNEAGLVVGRSNTIPGGPTVAVVWQLLPDGGDADGDGLLNKWERDGYDANGDGVIDVDLPAMGANALRKDLFLHVDYSRLDYAISWPAAPGSTLAPHSDKLPQEAVDRVVQAFLDAPISNPDGSTGIHLHIDNGPESLMNALTGELWGERSKQQALYHPTWYNFHVGDLHASVWESDALRASSKFVTSPRARIFRHLVTTHNLGSIMGASNVPDDHFYLWLETSVSHYSDVVLSSLVTMHEFGHSLGLPHTPLGEDFSAAFSTNHLSIMNYFFALTGLLVDGADGYLDYSRFDATQIPTLDMTRVNEAVGLNGPPAVDRYGTRWWCPTRYQTSVNGAVYPAESLHANGPLDLSCWGGIQDAVDITALGLNFLTSAVQVTQNDWSLLTFNAGLRGPIGTSLRPDDIDRFPRRHAPIIEGTGRSFLAPGASITHLYVIRNEGQETDRYTIAATSSAGWADLGSVPTALTLNARQEVSLSIPVTAPIAPGATRDVLQLRVVSQGNPRRTSVFVTETLIEPQRPVANAGADILVVATDPRGAAVRLNGSGSFSVSGQPLEYFWSGPFVGNQTIVSGVAPSVMLPLGVHEIALLVKEGDVDSARDTITVQALQGARYPCVYGFGAWKNTPTTWPTLSLTLGTYSYDALELLSIMGQPPRGNGALTLAHQLIAAKLNAAKGAAIPAEIDAAIRRADEQIGPLVLPPVGSGALRASATSPLVTLLAVFNEGQYRGGPPACVVR